jgi:hypothetical protein
MTLIIRKKMNAWYSGIYQTNALTNSRRKCIENICSGGEPFSRPLIASLSLNELSNPILLIENGQDRTGRSAVFEAGGELVYDEVVLGLLFVLV